MLHDFDRELTGQSLRKIRDNLNVNYSFGAILKEVPYVFSDGRTQVIVRLELEYNRIVPMVEVVTTRLKRERKYEEIRRYTQIIGHMIWETYLKLEEE